MKKKRVSQLIFILIYILILTPSPLISYSNPFIDVEGESLLAPRPQRSVASVNNVSSLLTIGSWGNPYTNYDPAIFGDVTFNQWRRHSLIYDTLVNYDPETGKITPSLAKQWVVSTDSKYWVFTLKHNIFFHDGSKFNASSVKFTFSRLFDPSNPAYIPKEDDLPLQSIEIKSEFKVIFHFFEPHAPFIYDEAANLNIISPNSFSGSILTNPIGTGPYKIDLSSSNSTLQNLTRFTEHFRGLPPFEQIHYRIYPTYDEVVNAIVSQEVDIVPAFYLHLAEIYLNDDYWNLTTSKKAYITFFGWFNHHRTKIADVNVRLALNYAINRQQLIDKYEGYASRAQSIVPPASPFYDNEVVGYPYNVEIAKDLLNEAGYILGSDGSRFTLKIVTLSSPLLIDPIIADLNAVGIEVNLTRLSSIGEAAPRWGSGEFDIFILGGSYVLNPQIEYDHLHSFGSNNNGLYSNPEVDYFLDKSQQSPVFQEREYYFEKVEQLVHQDAPYLLFINLDSFYARKSEITPFVELSYEKFVFTYLTPPPPSPSLRLSLAQNPLSQQDEKIFVMENVELSNKSIYFPFTDAVIVSEEKKSWKVSMNMSHNLGAFIPSQEMIGKFYLISADIPDVTYRFRCYYDPSEVEGFSPNQLTLFQYEEKEETWIEVDVLASNPSLRYVEIELKGGDKLLRLGETLVQLTYRYLPIFTLIIGSMVSFAVLTIFFNNYFTKRFKERFNL